LIEGGHYEPALISKRRGFGGADMEGEEAKEKVVR